MKKGAIHIDWVISMSIFLIYLIVLLVLIKPSYKPTYEGDVLTTMVKDEFLEQNNITAGLVVFKSIFPCEEDPPPSVKSQLMEKLPSNIGDDDIYFSSLESKKAYFIDSGDELGNDKEACIDVGEIVYYNGLKETLKKPGDFDFPRNYKIRIYNILDGGSLEEDKSNGLPFVVGGEPSSDDEVYVLEWSASKLIWDSGEKKIKRDNIIINIQVW